jgi:hypothetical protein
MGEGDRCKRCWANSENLARSVNFFARLSVLSHRTVVEGVSVAVVAIAVSRRYLLQDGKREGDGLLSA